MSLRRRMLLEEGSLQRERVGGGNGFGGGGGRHSSALQSGEVAVTAPRPEKLPPARIDDVDDYVELMYDDETKVSETAPAEERKREVVAVVVVALAKRLDDRRVRG